MIEKVYNYQDKGKEEKEDLEEDKVKEEKGKKDNIITDDNYLMYDDNKENDEEVKDFDCDKHKQQHFTVYDNNNNDNNNNTNSFSSRNNNNDNIDINNINSNVNFNENNIIVNNNIINNNKNKNIFNSNDSNNIKLNTILMGFNSNSSNNNNNNSISMLSESSSMGLYNSFSGQVAVGEDNYINNNNQNNNYNNNSKKSSIYHNINSNDDECKMEVIIDNNNSNDNNNNNNNNNIGHKDFIINKKDDIGCNEEKQNQKQMNTLTWNISYTVKKKTEAENIKILSDIKGEAHSGQMIALMGPSGSGKTSLLHCLALRNRNFNGSILLNGKPLDSDFFHLSGLIHQEDLFFSTITCYEHLLFHANVQLGNTHSKEEKLQLVNELIEQVGITRCAHSLIGGQDSLIRGISGGERKRLSVAEALISNPCIIFADEPTSGLDSFMANSICSLLRDIAIKKNKLVIASIHQPSSETFYLFTHIMLLAKIHGTGQLAYFGNISQCLHLLKECGNVCPDYYNPADYMIEIVSIKPRKLEKTKKRLTEFIEKYHQSNEYIDSCNQIEKLECIVNDRKKEARKNLTLHQIYNNTMNNAMSIKLKYNTGFSTHFWNTYKRTLLSYKREPIMTKARMMQSIFMGLMIGFVYLDVKTPQSILGVALMLVINQCVATIFGVSQTIPKDLRVFQREFMNRANRPSAFFYAKSFAELPYQIVFPAIFGTITYWMIGGFYHEYDKFFRFIILLILTSNAGASLGYLISCLVGNEFVAIVIGPIFMIPMAVLAGLMKRTPVSEFWGWLDTISFIKYGYQGIIYNQYHNDYYEFNLNDPARKNFMVNWDEILQNYFNWNLKHCTFEYCSTALIIFMVTNRFLAYLALEIRCRFAGSS